MNAAVALENQLLSMFGPLLSLATIIRFDPYYPHVNASFNRIAQQLLDQVGIGCFVIVLGKVTSMLQP